MTDLNNPSNELLPEAQANLYYTPSIEEFRVGFEYEYFNESLDEPDWEKVTFPNPWFHEKTGWIEFNVNRINSESVRVRRLCHDDIVGLGWEFKKDPMEHFPKMTSTFYKLTCQQGETWKLHFSSNTNTANISLGTLIAFSGTLKNRSELSFIMERVGIKTK